MIDHHEPRVLKARAAEDLCEELMKACESQDVPWQERCHVKPFAAQKHPTHGRASEEHGELSIL